MKLTASLHLKIGQKNKQRGKVCIPTGSIFRCELLVSGRVVSYLDVDGRFFHFVVAMYDQRWIDTPLQIKIVGRVLSFWEGDSSGAMFKFGGGVASFAEWNRNFSKMSRMKETWRTSNSPIGFLWVGKFLHNRLVMGCLKKNGISLRGQPRLWNHKLEITSTSFIQEILFLQTSLLGTRGG